MLDKERETFLKPLDMEKLGDDTPVTYCVPQLDIELNVDGGWVKRLQAVLEEHERTKEKKRTVELGIVGDAVIARTGIIEAPKKRGKKD